MCRQSLLKPALRSPPASSTSPLPKQLPKSFESSPSRYHPLPFFCSLRRLNEHGRRNRRRRLNHASQESPGTSFAHTAQITVVLPASSLQAVRMNTPPSNPLQGLEADMLQPARPGEDRASLDTIDLESSPIPSQRRRRHLERHGLRRETRSPILAHSRRPLRTGRPRLPLLPCSSAAHLPVGRNLQRIDPARTSEAVTRDRRRPDQITPTSLPTFLRISTARSRCSRVCRAMTPSLSIVRFGGTAGASTGEA